MWMLIKIITFAAPLLHCKKKELCNIIFKLPLSGQSLIVLISFFRSFFRCLGLKSPFIEFKAHVEVLSNLSISLNSSDPNGSVSNGGSFGNSMMAGNSFSYPLESAGNHSIQKQYMELVKKQQKWMIPSTENPIVMAAMNNKKEVTLIETKDQADGRRSIDHIDRKYIIPLALKVASPVHGGTATMTTTGTAATSTSTRKPPILPDTSPNIDDLKRHILMLQNLTKNDENFQSKFVVFPSLQRSIDGATSLPSPSATMKTSTGSTILVNGDFAHTILPPKSSDTAPLTTTTVRSPTTTDASAAATSTTTARSSTTTTKRTTIPTKRRASLNVPKQIWPINTNARDDELIQKSAEKITIVPQVFLQNDQTPMNDDSFERPPPPPLFDDDDNDANGNYHRRPVSANQPQKFSINDPKPTFLSSSMKRSQYASASNVPATKQQQQHKKISNANRNKDKQLRREMRKKCKEAPADQKQNCTKAFQISFNLTSAAAAAAIRSTKHNASNNNNNRNNNNSNNQPFHSQQQQQQYHRQSMGDSETRSNSARSKMNYIPPNRSISSKQPLLHSVNTNKRPINNFNAGRMTNDDDDTNDDGNNDGDDDDDALKQSILQRTIRSHRRHQRRNASVVINSMSRRDHPYSIGTPIMAMAINETVSDVTGAAAGAAASSVAAPYKERIDLNPDLCYKITGLSYGQQKLCAANTQIMPAISRGARAAIQVSSNLIGTYIGVRSSVI